MKQKRVEDLGLQDSDFWAAIYVHCPGCNRAATVSQQPLPGNVRLACPHCGYLKQKEGSTPAHASVFVETQYTCMQCGTPNQDRRKATAPFVTLTTCCKGCARYSRQWFAVTPDTDLSPKDPFMHLPLYLVTEVRGNVLWAYNGAHIQFLRGYTGATLRRRTPFKHHSIATRLPPWLLAAKNRDAVQKGLNKLEAMLATDRKK